ncbi:MAG: ABC-2 family transporter protein [Tissierellia bacterium]|nr:ABC-2 family transporter protein [Tissierellia bacterium]
MHKVNKFFRIMKVYIMLGWKDGTEYRKDLLINLVDFLVNIIMTIVFWTTLFHNDITFSNWEIKDLVILSILANVSRSFSEVFAGSWQIPEKVISGEIDKHLCRPTFSLLALVMESSQLDELLKGIIGAMISFFTAFMIYEYNISIVSIVLSFFSLIVGIFLITAFRILISLLSFWFGEIGIFESLLHIEDFKFERYPVEVYQKFKFIFFYIIPISYIATVPAGLLLKKAEYNKYIIIEVIVFLIFSLLIRKVYKIGLSKYESAGG